MIILKGRPISKKRNYLRAQNGRMYLSKTWKTWEELALWQLRAYKEKHVGMIHVEYTFEIKGRLSADLDNLMAGVNDILQDSGIIDNDKNIVSIKAVKHYGFKDFVTKIDITDVSSPPLNK